MSCTVKNPLRSTTQSANLIARTIQPDVFGTIILFCDNQTLAQLSLVCRAFDHQVIPSLYRQITVDFQRSRITVPCRSLESRNSSISCQVENDRITISTRFAIALRYARVLVIRGHKWARCQARYYTHGLPTQMLEALQNVHTVRLHTIRRSLDSSYTDPKDSTIAGLCDEAGAEVCHLVHLLRDRFVIYSRPPSGFALTTRTISPFQDIARPYYHHSTPISTPVKIPGKGQILIMGVYESTNADLAHLLRPSVFNAPITAVLQLPSDLTLGDPSSFNAEAIIQELASMMIQGGGSGVRFVCSKKVVTASLVLAKVQQKKRYSIMLGGQGELFQKADEKIQITDFDEVGKEPWIEAFKGMDVKDWY